MLEFTLNRKTCRFSWTMSTLLCVHLRYGKRLSHTMGCLIHRYSGEHVWFLFGGSSVWMITEWYFAVRIVSFCLELFTKPFRRGTILARTRGISYQVNEWTGAKYTSGRVGLYCDTAYSPKNTSCHNITVEKSIPSHTTLGVTGARQNLCYRPVASLQRARR